ncbi:MAG: NAD-dependent dehydratase, partial [Wenzhouxiangella sp.]
GRYLLELLSAQRVCVLAVSRQEPDQSRPGEIWFQQDLSVNTVSAAASVVISLGPLRFAEQYLLKNAGVGRLIALSSASTVFKVDSPDRRERELIAGLLATEARLERLCQDRSINVTILKPTMIYGGEQDGNVSYLADFMRRFGVVPYCGRGLRQPVHAGDLAALVCRCLAQGQDSNGSWLVGGGETIEYPTMLKRIADSAGLSPRLVRLPAWSMMALLTLAHGLGRLEGVSLVMVRRQRQDLAVDDRPARASLGWNPRPFRPDRMGQKEP